MAGIESWVGIISGVLAILGVVAAVTHRWTKVQEETERGRIVAENRDLARKVQELEARRDQLLEQISVAGRAGNAALHQKTELDAALRSIMAATDASGGSIYVPVRSQRGEVHGLAFLSLEPFSPQTAALRAKIIPLKSLAGRAFTKGDSFAVSNAAKSAEHFKTAEKLSNYRPSTTLNIALKQGDEVVGVLQLLSKEGEVGFSEADVARVAALSKPIAEGVAAVARSPDSLRALGLGDESKAVEGSVVYFDLSSSSLLFQELSSSFALQLLNEYFEQVCEAAFRAGATLDNYMGDGALLRFNVPRPQPDHELQAVRAAVEMNRAFADIKEYWTALSPQFAAIQHRAGIATGPLLRASLGHSQLQSLTVIGYPISVAAALCEAAERDRTIIIADRETYEATKDFVVAKPIESSRLGKAARFTDGAWEITALT
ncbi:MAG TPA: GAF domain-containing protein [Sphingomicrobium sp.]|nr:GAF domain-containing protein [Sphingomicrobium sp.]